MTAVTPHLAGSARLSEMASRYVNVDALPWQPTRWAGIDMKVLVEEPETGLLTALFRWAPGSQLPLHEHVLMEQTYVLQGSLVDEEGEAKAGEFVWRPAGSRHVARSPNGALILGFFLAPNRFLTAEQSGAQSAGAAAGRDRAVPGGERPAEPAGSSRKRSAEPAGSSRKRSAEPAGSSRKRSERAPSPASAWGVR